MMEKQLRWLNTVFQFGTFKLHVFRFYMTDFEMFMYFKEAVKSVLRIFYAHTCKGPWR
jgi:hypothetical protein